LITVHFVGSGDAFGSGGRFQSCLLLRGAGDDVLVDCGATSLVAMKRAGIDPSRVRCVFLTHLHGDHFGGLPFLILDGQFSRRTMPLSIVGPPGVRGRVSAAMEVFFPGSSTIAQRFGIEFIELQERTPAVIGPATVTPYAVEHASGASANALRVEYGGKVIACSGDTEWTESLQDAARGADLFICEAYFFEKRIKYHLDYQTLRSQMSQLACRRIILTHMSDDMLGHTAEVGSECAQDGTVVTL
jgi:ribonuclease BN (tRNA processing enzyme)